MTADCTLDLTVTVEIEEWSYIKRRLGYLEALLLRILREESAIQEWFSAAELEAMRLPGLPPSLRGIARKATAENWPSIWRNRKYHYHVSALPARAYDALIARLIDLPPLDHDLEGVFSLPSPPSPKPLPENAAPPWVLPLMRLMKGEAEGHLGRAWQSLPDHLPEGTFLPDADEAAKILVRLGLAKG